MFKTYIIFTQEHLDLSCIEFFPFFDTVLIFLHILVFMEYWVLVESRIPLKLVLGSMTVVALSVTVKFCKGFILAKFRENKILVKLINHSVVY